MNKNAKIALGCAGGAGFIVATVCLWRYLRKPKDNPVSKVQPHKPAISTRGSSLNGTAAGSTRDGFSFQCEAYESLFFGEDDNITFFREMNEAIEGLSAKTDSDIRQKIMSGHLGSVMLGNALVGDWSYVMFSQFDMARQLLVAAVDEAAASLDQITEQVFRGKIRRYVELLDSPFRSYRPTQHVQSAAAN